MLNSETPPKSEPKIPPEKKTPVQESEDQPSDQKKEHPTGTDVPDEYKDSSSWT